MAKRFLCKAMPEKSKKTDSKRPAEVRRLKSRINRLRARIPRLESEIDELIRKAFPRGSEIHWMRGGRHQRGYVLHYAGAERFLEPISNSPEQHIHACQLHEAQEILGVVLPTT